MKSYEKIEADGFESQTKRYKRIEENNLKSFFVIEGSPLHVLQSIHSLGVPRDILSSEYEKTDDPEVKRELKDKRKIIDGNMSPLNEYGPSELSVKNRKKDAKKNVESFLYMNDINQSDVRLLLPERDYETPLTVIDLDTVALTPDDTGLLRPDVRGDMMYTYNPNIVMAARPADCPVAYITAETPKGTIYILLHLATLGVASGYIKDAKQTMDNLQVDWESVRIQLTAGGHAENYNYVDFTKFDPRVKYPESHNLFVNVEETVTKKGQPAWNFDVDVAAEAYEGICNEMPIEPYQVYLDTTDTTSPTAGYSSNTRAFKGFEVDGDNTRDIVMARLVR
ncbi:MAG: hypothetical protein JWO54_698 [Candidatus Saccharibacteria bacterium]|nr:hypothetical protein [Candidatus Saccharibacteria bacterium]MDB5180935.1 hypothetical protein [Candidatus Saccharibacteria bacterium]